MKNRFLTGILLFSISFILHGQDVFLYDFNDLEIGDLDGQDGWVTIANKSAGTDFIIATSLNNTNSADGTKAAFFCESGPSVGRDISRKASENFPFDFSLDGQYELEFDLYKTYWGASFGIGWDRNENGYIAPGLAGEEDDGGLRLNISVQNPLNNKIVLPNGQVKVFSIENEQWDRYKMAIDFDANGGKASLSMYYKKWPTSGSWLEIPEIQNINLFLDTLSNTIKNPKKWDTIFSHSEGCLGAVDNIVVRQPGGVGLLSQFISFAQIPKKLNTEPSFPVRATASSGLPVFFEVVSGPASITDSIITLSGEEGIVVVRASQPGDTEYLPAEEVEQSFEVINPLLVDPEIKVRTPGPSGVIFMPELRPVLLKASASIEHDDLLFVEKVLFTIGSDEMELTNWGTGYFSTYWTPPDYGSFILQVAGINNSGAVKEETFQFEIHPEAEDLNHPGFEGIHLSPSKNVISGEFELPAHTSSYNQIVAVLNVTCPENGCDPWDRVAWVQIKGPNGKWFELIRYITPYGVPCLHTLDVTDYMSALQGLVEWRAHIGTLDRGFVFDLEFSFLTGEPEYPFSWIDVIWHKTYPFGDYANLQPVDTIMYHYPPNTSAAKLKLVNTGHGWNSEINTANAAEFYPADHNIYMNREQSFEQFLWVDCEPNPDFCHPQNGTWYYNRAGWCPGSIAKVYDFDLSPSIGMDSVELIYEFDTDYVDFCHPNHPACVSGVTCDNCNAGFNPHYVVAGNLITYSHFPVELTSTRDIGPKQDIKWWPNPSSGYIRLSCNEDLDDVEIRAISLNGRNYVIKSPEILLKGDELKFDLRHLLPGVYFMHVRSKQGMNIKKIVIQK